MKEQGARALYTAAWWFAAPLVALYLTWRSLRQPEYRRHWRERFLGRGDEWMNSGRLGDGQPSDGETIWLHAVSVGETRAAQPLIEQLAHARPRAHFVLTHMTPTGRAVGEVVAAALPGRVRVRYLPYELPFALRRFMHEVRPRLGIVMETEVWPNLLFAAREARVPMALVNARLSEKSLARARRFSTLLRAAARTFVRMLAQTDADRARLATLYEGPIDITGNLKFDHMPDAELVARGRARRGDRPVILLASSRDGEEMLLLDEVEKCSAQKIEPDPIFWIVPRHPQRFDDVRRSIEKLGSGSIFLGDTMGEMPMYYALADVTLMGGSFLPFGSQNLIESCAVGTPVILGPSTFNFAQVALDAVAAGAAIQVATMAEALRGAQALLRDRERLARMRAAALAFANTHRGATARTVAVLNELLNAD